MHQSIRNCIFQQIKSAFESTPNTAGTIHGLRKIAQGQPGRSTSLFPSRKAGGAVPLESRLELAHAVWLEKNTEVIDYRAQALVIDLPGNRVAFPDFLVKKSNGDIEVHEVKPSYKNLKSDEKEKINIITAVLADVGIKYKVFDTATLLSRRQVEKLLALYSHGHMGQWSDQQKKISLHLLLGGNLTSLTDAYNVLSHNDLPIQLASFHLFHGRYSISAWADKLEVNYV